MAALSTKIKPLGRVEQIGDNIIRQIPAEGAANKKIMTFQLAIRVAQVDVDLLERVFAFLKPCTHAIERVRQCAQFVIGGNWKISPKISGR